MGIFYPEPASSLVVFRKLFSAASWEEIAPDQACLADAEDSGPEACFRKAGHHQLLEASLHLPLDQVSLAVSDEAGDVTFRLFFFYRKNFRRLVQTLASFDCPVRLHELNNTLKETAPFCLFTLLELPGEGLFEVGPQKEIV